MHPTETAMRAVAATQRGRFTRAQVAAVDPNARSYVQSRLRKGDWVRLTTRVLALPGAPMDPEADLWTAHLHFGAAAAISHTSAALLHRYPHLPAHLPLTPEVTVAAGGHRRSGRFTVHQSNSLSPADLTVVRGLPVTTVARTLVDLAPMFLDPRVEAWFDHLVAERLLTPADVAAVLDRLHGPGRAGLDALVDMVGDRMAGPGIEQGALERELTKVLLWSGLGMGVAQFPHPGRPDGGALVDRAFPAARLVVEADGRRWHDRRRAAHADKRRDRAAAAAGWLTVRYEWADLVGAPEASATEIRSIHDARLAA